MASSQLEIVSSSPFGCVLRDHNRKERCRDSNVRSVQAVFDKNLNDLVRDHINGCISLSSPQNSETQINNNNVASWVTAEQPNGSAKSMKSKEPSATPNIPRPPPVLDRWVTRQSSQVDGTVSTLEKHVNEVAEQPLLPPTTHSNIASPTTSNSTSKNAQNSSTQLEKDNAASSKHNLGASSLVQIWEARLNRSNSINSNQNQSQCMDSESCRTNSGVSSIENDTEETPPSDPFEEKFENRTNNADSLTDWDSQSITVEASSSSSSCSRTLDAGKTQWVRIADIVKRLKTCKKVEDDHEQSNNENKHCSTSDQAAQRCFSLIVNSPRLRGRQAFHDFLIRIVRDKNRELDSLGKRQAVSKFSQRGRIQSMLRLKSLQRCLTIQDKCRPQLPANRLVSQGSGTIHHREKFSTGAEHVMTVQNVSASQRCPKKDKGSSCKPQKKEDSHCVEPLKIEKVTTPLEGRSEKIEDVHEQAKPTSDAVQQKSIPEAICVEQPKIEKATTPLEGQSENETEKKQDLNDKHLLLGSQETVETKTTDIIEVVKPEQEKDQNHLTLGLQESMEIITSLNSSIGNDICGEEEIGDQQDIRLESRSQDIVEKPSTMSYINDINENEVTEDEEEDYEQYFDETNGYDWFSNISRPRSYWEGLRKAWYQEVLNTNSKNEDIRQLLERGRVSTLLSSDFRESMDRLLSCHVQMQAEGVGSEQDLEDYEEIRSRGRVSNLISSDFLERMNRLMSSRVQVHDSGAESRQEVEGKGEMVKPMSYQAVEEDDDGYEDDDEEEERSLSSHQCGQEEANNYFDHSSSSLQVSSPSALMMRSWSFQDDNETSNDYERGASLCSPPTQPSDYERGASLCSPPTQPSQAQCYQEARESSSSTNRPSVEMELICDLRGHIEQLHNEMSELRKSIVSCMEMQMKMQQNSYNREVHSVEMEGKNSEDRTPWKRSCFICHEMQVNSLLYRCGHMCTCLKCGQELQWRSGKCPICQAPILDVVPAK